MDFFGDSPNLIERPALICTWDCWHDLATSISSSMYIDGLEVLMRASTGTEMPPPQSTLLAYENIAPDLQSIIGRQGVNKERLTTIDKAKRLLSNIQDRLREPDTLPLRKSHAESVNNDIAPGQRGQSSTFRPPKAHGIPLDSKKRPRSPENVDADNSQMGLDISPQDMGDVEQNSSKRPCLSFPQKFLLPQGSQSEDREA